MIRSTGRTGTLTIAATTIALLSLFINPTIELNVRDEKAKDVLQYMNIDIDPCKDFYDFACGNWAEQNCVENEGEMIRVQDKLEHSINEQVDKILSTKIKPPDTKNERSSIVKEFYKHCKNEPISTQLNFLVDFARRHGGANIITNSNFNEINYRWVHEVAKLRGNYGLEILIGMDIDENTDGRHGNSIYFGEPKTTLIPAHLCSEKATKDKNFNDPDYEAVQNEVAQNLRSWFSLTEAYANDYAGEIVGFEYGLCKKMRTEESMYAEEEEEEVAGRNRVYPRLGQKRLKRNRNRGQYAHKTLQDFQRQFNNTINFKSFVDIVFQNSINDMVYMRSETYFKHLAQRSRISKPQLANYIMYRAVSSLNFPVNDDRTIRRNHCVNLVLRYFPTFIGELYVREYFRGDTVSDVGFVFNYIKSAISVLENNVTEYLNVKPKLGQFNLKFPSYRNTDSNNLQMEHLNYWNTLEKAMNLKAKEDLEPLFNYGATVRKDAVEAADLRIKAMPLDSEVFIGWGLMQRPYYDYYYAKSLKYALLGQGLAREIVYAFDESSDNSNNMRNSYGGQSVDFRRETHECFRAQFSNYLYNNPTDFRNDSKVRELIADSSGLNIAFNAYLLWLDSMDSMDLKNRQALSRETLPDVNYTNTQLFFINFAQMRCVSKFEKEPKMEYLPLDQHTYERYDVNGPLMNNEEFAREFGCAAGTEMNPGDKCVLY